mmetsp:Transcript_26833/g.83290  ORF Transcript_26833/g.83290 Transcript_26833/m.83290 type:complete len:570 (-) Transcript_26833:8-1717(-)
MAAAEALQPLLEQAVRESLRELARCAVEPEVGGASQSIECIVRNVSARVLEEAGGSLATSLNLPVTPAAKPAKKPALPLLQDLEATPWVVWREGSAVRSRVQSEPVQCEASAPGPGGTKWPRGAGLEAWASDEARPEVPEDASRRSQQSSQHLEELAQHGMVAWQEDEIDPAQLPRRSVSACIDAHLLLPPALNVESSGCIPSLCSPVRGPKSCALMSSFSAMGDSPLIVKEGLKIESNSALHLMMQWMGRPRAVLVVAKPGDRLVTATVHDIVAWLSSQGIVVVLEPQLLADQPDLRGGLKSARTFSKGDQLARAIDLVITVGGDGTLTWAVSLFHGAMPPVLSFAAGSLGFLTPFPLDGWVRTLTNLLDLHRPRKPVPLVCRMRLRVVVHRRNGGLDYNDCDGPEGDGKNIQVQCLNEVLVHRGKSGALAKLDVGVDGERVTLVQGDGLILATPTGSTAYSLAAGGSMVHPGVPAILLTPVSPHSLSFRPALLPDSAVVTVSVPLSARCGAALSVDGKDICTLRLGDSVEVAMSPHPVPTICCTTETLDWFASVHEALQWNGRAEQK